MLGFHQAIVTRLAIQVEELRLFGERAGLTVEEMSAIDADVFRIQRASPHMTSDQAIDEKRRRFIELVYRKSMTSEERVLEDAKKELGL